MRYLPYAALVAALVSSNASAKAPLRKFDLRIVVAVCSGKPARDKKWIDAHVQATKKIFAAHRIAFKVSHATFRPKRCELLIRAHRNSMAQHVTMDGPATVLVMPRVRDIDVTTYNLSGVHWRYGGKDPQLKGRRWVFLTAKARPPVLAHELGHFFGLRHDRGGGNLMTPGPSDKAWRGGGPKPKPWRPILLPAQAQIVRRNIVKFVKP